MAKTKGSIDFAKRVCAAGYCCPHAAIRILIRPEDTLPKIAKMLKVSISTIKYKRADFREGKLPCERKPTCLRMVWLTPKKGES